jgi:hypothetical protein
VAVQSLQEVVQVGGGELPLERLGGLVVAGFEIGEALCNDVGVVEFIGCQQFSLDDGEDDLVG